MPHPLLRIGGALGIAAVSISLLIFVVGCFGFQAVFTGLPLVPLVLALPGLVLTLAGGILGNRGPDADTRILSAVFVNGLGLFAALLEIAVWQNWPLFFTSQQAG
jgi:hypothetical protein